MKQPTLDNIFLTQLSKALSEKAKTSLQDTNRWIILHQSLENSIQNIQ